MNFTTDMYDNIKLYLDNMRSSNYAKNTVVAYEIHLRNFYSYCRQNQIDYKNISVKDMLQYKIVISKIYKFTSINAKISVIKSFYNFLIDIEEAKTNPIRDSMYIRKDRKNPNPLSKDQEALFYSYIETKEKHIELGFKLMFDTGIRISELVALEKKDVQIIDGRVYLHIRNQKNGNQRLVPVFSDFIIKDLLTYIKGNFDNTIFFYTSRAYQLHAEEFSKLFNISFTTHMARHTFATRKLNEGMRIDILQKILGHADIRTTMYYCVTDELEILKLGGYEWVS